MPSVSPASTRTDVRPACYGQYSAHPRSPCRGCALQGPCVALVSDPEGFSLLARPRYLKPTTTYAVSTAAFFPEVANELHRGFGQHGLERGGGTHDAWYWLKTKPRTRFGHLMEARPGHVVFYFDCIRIDEARKLSTVRRLPVSVFYNRPEYPGVLAVAGVPAPLIEVALDVATHARARVGSKHDLS